TVFLAIPLTARAQSFNVDIGPNVVDPTPSSTYGAGASQPGYWHAWAGNSPSSLVRIDGTASSASAQYLLNPTGWGETEADLAGPSGEGELLMDDRREALTTFGSIEDIEVSGLWNGEYDVFTYCFDSLAGTSRVQVLGSSDPAVVLGGGTFPGSQIQGQTYA